MYVRYTCVCMYMCVCNADSGTRQYRCRCSSRAAVGVESALCCGLLPVLWAFPCMRCCLWPVSRCDDNDTCSIACCRCQVLIIIIIIIIVIIMLLLLLLLLLIMIMIAVVVGYYCCFCSSCRYYHSLSSFLSLSLSLSYCCY